MKDDLVLVTGAGGFIGGSLVADLRQKGYRKIRAVDVKPTDEWYQVFPDVENLSLDLNLINPANQRHGALIFAGRDGRPDTFAPTQTHWEPAVSWAINPWGSRRVEAPSDATR